MKALNECQRKGNICKFPKDTPRQMKIYARLVYTEDVKMLTAPDTRDGKTDDDAKENAK